jgi:hypothetical protein
MNRQTKKRGQPVPPIRINNTGRIVFNQEAAERIGRPRYMDVIIHGHNVRVVPTDEASDNALCMSYPKQDTPYTFTATPHLKPLGFEPGTGPHRTLSTLSCTATAASSSGSRLRRDFTRNPTSAGDAR